MKVIALLTVLVLIGGCSSFLSFDKRQDFIRVEGTRFVLNGKPYYFAGTNLWYGCYLGSPAETGDRERLKRELDFLKAHGLVNLRVLAASEESYIKRSIKPALQRKPGDVDENLFIGLDYLLNEMRERQMHAVIYLNNYWEWSGGMAQYNAWTGADGVDPEDASKGWGAFMNFSATFYSNEKANQMYRDFVKRIITRHNTITGGSYNEDPTIMSWQLANEPRPGTDSPEGKANLPAFYRWLDETAAYIHSLDPNHLVSTGSEGTVGCLQSEEYFLAAHAPKHIDYLTFHLWPLNWGWFDPAKFEETLPRSTTNALEYIDKHLALARQLKRPIVMEEFGLGRDGGGTVAGTPTTARDRYFTRIFAALYDSASAGAPIAGSNIWAWGGEGRGSLPGGMWERGDPFVGDPPQEPQGRNSIFDIDTSTLKIIRDHAFQMRRLCEEDSLLAGKITTETLRHQGRTSSSAEPRLRKGKG